MTEWPVLELGAYPVEIIDGDRGAEYPKTADFTPGGYCLFLNAGNVTANGFAFDQCAYISEEKDKKLRKGRLLRNDTVATTRGTVGNFAFYDRSVPMSNIRINSGMVILRPDQRRVDPRFLYFAVRSPLFGSQIKSLTSGSAQPQLPIRDMKKLRLPLPPIQEQRSIVDAIGSLDDKIKLNRRMNETLEAMAQAIFRDWFVDFGPTRRKLNGALDPITIMGGLVQDTELAQALADQFPAALGDDGLPEGWFLGSIYSAAKVIYGAPFASKQFNDEGRGRPLARIRDLPRHLGGVFTEEVHSKEYLINAGDIVVGMDGEFRAYLWQGDRTLMNQRVCCFSPLDPANRAFVYLGIQPLLATHEKTAIGTTVIHLGKKEIDGFQIPSGGGVILQKFGEFAEPLIAKIVANGQESRTLAATRDLLLPKLMSGEISLSEAEDLAEAVQ